MARNEQQITIEDARIAFRNFEGKEDQYNRAGNRNFAVLLPPEIADQLAEDGWNIKTLKPREEGDIEQPYIQVNVSYKVRPPKIVLLTSRNRTFLDEDTVSMLDWADIEHVDLVFTPYNWTVGNESGIKAYLKTMFIRINEDPLELKYADLMAEGSAVADLEPNE